MKKKLWIILRVLVWIVLIFVMVFGYFAWPVLKATYLNNQGMAAERSGNYAKAEPLLREALAMRKAALPAGHPHIAITLNNLADLLRTTGRYGEAEPLHREALAMRKAALPPGHPGIAISLNNLAALLYTTGRYGEAEPLYREALAMRKTALPAGHPHIAISLNNLALLFETTGRYGEAEPLYREALAMRKTALPAGHPDIAASLNNLALLLKTTGRYGEAEPLHREALAMHKAALPAGHPAIATSLNNLALLLDTTGRYGEAESLYREALAMQKAALPPGHPDIALSLNNLAALLSTTGRYGEAEPLYRETLAIRKAALPAGHPDIATSLNNLALLLETTGRYGEAEPLYREALAMWKAALPAGHPDIATGLNNLAILLDTTGRYDEAEPLYREALAMRKAALSAGHPDIAKSLNNLARLLNTTGRYGEAEPLYREALAMQKAALPTGHPDIATGLNNLARLLDTTARYGEAEPLYREALAMWKAALPAGHPDIASSLNNLGFLLNSTGRSSEAGPLLTQALQIAQGAGAPEILWIVLGNLSARYAAQDQRNLAIFFDKQSVNTLQGVRQNLAMSEQSTRQAFLKSKAGHYKRLADLLIAEGRLPEAQQVLRMLKEQEFFDFIRRESADDPRLARVADTPFEAEQRARLTVPGETLAALGAELRDLRRLKLPTPAEQARIRDLEARRQQATDEFQTALEGIITAFKTQRQSLVKDRGDMLNRHLENAEGSMTDLLAALEAQSGRRLALVQYLEMPDKLHILLTLGRMQRAVSVPVGEADLNRAIQTFRDPGEGALLRPDLDPRPQAQWLYERLIAPIAAELTAGKVQILMVYLDGALRYLPLAALHDGKHWLVERYALAVYTAVKDDNLKDTPTPAWRAAGFGVSTEHAALGPTRRRFKALEQVPRELHGIIRDPPQDAAGVLPGRIWLDPAFTAAALAGTLEGGGYQVIHLATHFALESGYDDSYLLLGDGRTLTLKDLRRQRFAGVDLVTLSACDTAVELTAYAGREVEGLGTLVQQKGAKGVIATLWPVADASTGRFMQELYRLRADHGLDKAETLRLAQLGFLRGQTPVPPLAPPAADRGGGLAPQRQGVPFPTSAPGYRPDPARPYAHPYFWAPFILMGNWL